jgi:hypothetical protein
MEAATIGSVPHFSIPASRNNAPARNGNAVNNGVTPRRKMLI